MPFTDAYTRTHAPLPFVGYPCRLFTLDVVTTPFGSHTYTRYTLFTALFHHTHPHYGIACCFTVTFGLPSPVRVTTFTVLLYTFALRYCYGLPIYTPFPRYVTATHTIGPLPQRRFPLYARLVIRNVVMLNTVGTPDPGNWLLTTFPTLIHYLPDLYIERLIYYPTPLPLLTPVVVIATLALLPRFPLLRLLICVNCSPPHTCGTFTPHYAPALPTPLICGHSVTLLFCHLPTGYRSLI